MRDIRHLIEHLPDGRTRASILRGGRTVVLCAVIVGGAVMMVLGRC